MKKPAPSDRQIDRAFRLASEGRAGKLVDIIRSFGKDDLVRGLSATRGNLRQGIAYAAGRKDYREKTSSYNRALKKANRKAAP